MRLFLAINLDPAIRRDVYEAAAPLREAAPALRWVREENLHLTLKFFGEQLEPVAGALGAAITRVAAGYRAIDLELGGAGAFPNFRRPRVVWLGVHPDPKLELLHHDVELACETLGFPLEGRAFRPHLTLARVQPRDADLETRKTLSRLARRVRYTGETVVSSIDLMQSTLTSSGARYELVASAPLRFS